MQLLLDLKVCEGCGSLWYRATGGAEVYCKACVEKLGDFPVPRRRSRPGGRRKLAGGLELVGAIVGGDR